MSNHLCTECGKPHIVNDPHKEVLNRMKLSMLKAAASHVMNTMTNDFQIKNLGEISNYNNFQKLRYHGLVAHVKKNGVLQRGHWLITKNGWSFLRGQISLPRYVLVQENHIKSRSDQLIGLKDIYYAENYITTNFEYFDDAGLPVGFRPAFHTTAKQESLL